MKMYPCMRRERNHLLIINVYIFYLCCIISGIQAENWANILPEKRKLLRCKCRSNYLADLIVATCGYMYIEIEKDSALLLKDEIAI